MPHPAIMELLRFFAYDPEGPQGDLLGVYFDAAGKIAATCTGAEATVALRKLLESRDAALRAVP